MKRRDFLAAGGAAAFASMWGPALAQGASIRQGMHHSAQKSTSTGTSDLSTSASKFPSVNSFTFSLAIECSLQSETASTHIES